MLKVLLAISLAFCSLYAMSDKELANSINLAGKERMLTQKMSKEALLIKLGIDKKKNAKELKATSALFDRILKGLQTGDKTLGLVATKDKNIQEHLKGIDKQWQEFYKNIKKIYSLEKDESAYAYVKENNLALLENMNRAVSMYAKLGNSGGNKLKMANDINLAGKQRMLTQMIAKDILMYQANMDAQEKLANLNNSLKLFDETLNGLYNGDKKLDLVGTKLPKIRKQLDVAKSSWSRAKDLIPKAIKNKNDKKLTKELINYLDETKVDMNKAVGLYTKSLNRQKQYMKLNSIISGFSTKKNRAKHLVNLAGKLRMLTQRISKLAIECTLHLIPDSCNRLEQFVNLYKKTLLGFKNGDKALDLEATNNKEALAQIDKLLKLWKPFEDAALKVQNSGGKNKEALNYILKHNGELLKESNHLVEIFDKIEQKYSNYIENANIALIDMAGRQRMLTQKMTKEFLAIYQMGQKEYKPKLKESVELFNNTLKVLINGSKLYMLPKCTNPIIKKQLVKVSNLWQKIMPFYNKNDLSKKELVLLLKVNPILLNEMNKAVHLIETSTEY